ncbi:MAG: NnrS family protein [Hyphomicrobiaceae bacterium]
MATTAEQRRGYQGPAVLSYGFRPFFLAAAFWAALAMAIWLLMLSGRVSPPITLAPVAWHAHELVFGYVPAVVAGFLLTAVPNWTGRLPVVGRPLLGLFLVWLAGRVAMLISSWIGAPVAALIDLAFLVVLISVMAREIVAGGNWRNLKVLGGVGVLLAGNLLFHAEVISGGDAGRGLRMGIAGAVLLILLIGGRIIPSFTRNWLVRRAPGRLPRPFDSLDAVAIAASAVALLLWVLWPEHEITAVAALLAGGLNAGRLARWAGERTAAEPLVLILHVAYAFVPIGFVLVGFAGFYPQLLPATGAVHGWTSGAIALMTLAVMTRASLGHTGQPLAAMLRIQLIYLFALIAVLTRLLAAFAIGGEPMLLLSAVAWIGAFGGFCLVYAPLLLVRRA